uniref:B30.2/SPRY domain-containing protein n=1 Tax=Knipowitschia caucasica TaxID=637954 RepID=A0AAV2JX95_KNICA
MIEGRIQKMNRIQEAVELSRNNSEIEAQEGLHIFTKLLQLIQKDHAELREVINTKQKQVESNAKGVMLELEQEINELRKRSTQLEHLSNTTDNLYLLKTFPALSQLPDLKDRCDTVVKSAVYVGTLRRAIRKVGSKIDENIKDEVKRLCTTEFQRAQQYAVNVNLDLDTAHPKLVLSEDRKQVYHNDIALKVPENPKRFYPCVSVLGKDGFSSGRFYFEVVVKGKTEWDIGVGRESMNRKGGNTLNPENGYWALGMRNPKSYWALNSTPIVVPLVSTPQKMGIYVDMEGGQVSFYDVDTACHIYSFTGYSFTEKLFPYFNPRRNHGGTNSAPLIISLISV